MPNQPYNEDQNSGRNEPYNYGAPPNGQRGGNPYQNGQNANRQAPRYNNKYSANSSDFANLFGGQNGQPFQFPWWAILIGFAMWWPLGFVFLGLNAFLKNDSKTQNRYVPPPPRRDTYAPPQTNTTQQQAAPQARQAPPRPSARPAAAQSAPSYAKANVEDKKKSEFDTSLILGILGIVFAVTGMFWAGGAVASILSYGVIADYMYELLSGILFLVGSTGMFIASGISRTSRRMRRRIINIVGNADSMFIEDIAGAISCNYEKCCKHLEECIEKGDFGDSAYIDMRTRCLVVRGKAPRPAPAAASAPAPDGKKSGAKYQATLRELEQLNDAIPGEVMSAKITRLQGISQKIFEQAEANPDKLPQMRKFMDYYLPTALKLLKTYAELDAQGIEGDNISESKRRIEQVMDTMVTAFENQLDQLFQSDAMDVSADIDVMENMLRADGLSEDSNDPFHLYHKGAP